MAIQMLRVMKNFRTQQDKPVVVRIGINTGDVLTGVVGNKRPQFSLFGDTINTAARMQSKAPPNRIQISPSTMEMVRGAGFTLEPYTIVAKGKGEMHCALIGNAAPLKKRESGATKTPDRAMPDGLPGTPRRRSMTPFSSPITPTGGVDRKTLRFETRDLEPQFLVMYDEKRLPVGRMGLGIMAGGFIAYGIREFFSFTAVGERIAIGLLRLGYAAIAGGAAFYFERRTAPLASEGVQSNQPAYAKTLRTQRWTHFAIFLLAGIVNAIMPSLYENGTPRVCAYPSDLPHRTGFRDCALSSEQSAFSCRRLFDLGLPDLHLDQLACGSSSSAQPQPRSTGRIVQCSFSSLLSPFLSRCPRPTSTSISYGRSSCSSSRCDAQRSSSTTYCKSACLRMSARVSLRVS
jgi:hypothetical protein